MINHKIAIGAALIGAFILGAAIVAYPSAQEQPAQSQPAMSSAPKERVSTSFSELEEEEIGDIVRAYLLENPEVIIEAVNEYSARERQAAAVRAREGAAALAPSTAENYVTLAKTDPPTTFAWLVVYELWARLRAREGAAANLSALLSEENGFVTGKKPDTARIAVIEMFDYHCGYCKRATSLVREIAKNDDDVKVIFRELPILREESEYAAEVSLAAREQGKFLEMHFAMMDAKGVLTKERIHDIAKKEGVDVEKLEQDAQKPGVARAIIEGHDIAEQAGVNGTPAFIIAAVDGSYIDVVSGYYPDELLTKIEEAKASAQ